MDRIASKLPGSPWRPQRPASCRSILPASCRSVRITCSPPSSAIPGPSFISVPLPAMFVAMVTAAGLPASATIAASSLSFFALSTQWAMPASLKHVLRLSEAATERVPMSTGRPLWKNSSTRSTTAIFFSDRVGATRPGNVLPFR